jgi:hypothetical protein
VTSKRSSSISVAIEETSSWAGGAGTPSSHVLRAALHVARQVDAEGAPIPSVHTGYTHYSSGGVYPPEDLRLGEQLLLALGLLREEDDFLYPSGDITEVVGAADPEAYELLFVRALEFAQPAWVTAHEAAPEEVTATVAELISDPERREAFLLAIGAIFDETARKALGARGEEVVADALREQLIGFGRHALANEVCRVSLISDALGYDIVAPRLDETKRRIEVKTAGRADVGLVKIYLSRNETEVGRRDPAWSLVVCRLGDDEEISVVGWCRGSALEPYLPGDRPAGRWVQAELEIPEAILISGLPPAI